MKKLILIFLALPILCFSQKNEIRKGSYSGRLTGVEVSNNIKSLTLDSLLSSYEDSIIKIKWEFHFSELYFEYDGTKWEAKP